MPRHWPTQKGERERETKRQRQAERQRDRQGTHIIIFTQLMNMYRPQDYSTYPSCTYAGFLEIEREYKQLSKFET